MSESEKLGPWKGVVTRSLIKILVFYVLFIATLVWLVIQFPTLEEYFTGGRLQELAGQGGQDFPGEITTSFGGTQREAVGLFGWQNTPVAALSMIAALLVMIPTAWSYIIIKARGGYNQSVVHTLLILPIAVTGIVIVVQNSIALAFSLAGIVAAVRFRTTLDDTKDAVYVFLAIGVGLACGVQALGVAVALSMIFNIVNLILWRFNFGNIYVDQLGRTSALGLGDVLAGPGSAETALQIGDSSLLTALSPREVKEVAEHRERLESYLDSVTDRHKERKRYSILLIHTKEVGEVQKSTEEVLDRGAARWRLAEILPGKDGLSVLEYLVRVKDGIPTGAVLDAIRRDGGDRVVAAEMRSLRGLKKKKP